MYRKTSKTNLNFICTQQPAEPFAAESVSLLG
jgi:hypothetical protein